MLLTVSGIGPKSALAIIGHIELSALKTAVATSDLRLLTKIPGIGKKTAERLVIEMRDKLKKFVSISSSEPLLVTDAISTLVNLGYPLINAQRAVQNAFNENKSTDLSQLIALSLKKV
jgi:Holliday junction DNA helicase RuvA